MVLTSFDIELCCGKIDLTIGFRLFLASLKAGMPLQSLPIYLIVIHLLCYRTLVLGNGHATTEKEKKKAAVFATYYFEIKGGIV